MKKSLKVLAIASILVATTIQAQELKIGVLQHDFDKKFNHRVEQGQNIVVEYLFDKMDNYLRAFPHIGASINSKGYTSNLYTGLTWQVEFSSKFLVEASLGASINNAERKMSKKRRGLGSNLLFRESFSVGYKLSDIHSVSLMIDHISSADIAKPNPGLTDIGIRYGYRF
jgi:lipid A 3-O-deacylase